MRNTKEEKPLPSDVRYLQDTLHAVSGKWKLPILYSLGLQKRKFRELQRDIPGITSRMLARELKDLELHGFIIRRSVDDFSNVSDYEITAYCKSFENIILAMIEWGKGHRALIQKRKLPVNADDSSG